MIKFLFIFLLSVLLAKATFALQKIDSAIRSVITAKVGAKKFNAVLRTDNSITVINSKKHIISKFVSKDLANAGISGIKFSDFNRDGYKDILVDYFTNTPAVEDLLLCDKKHLRFVKVKGFSEYPDPIKLSGTNLYYSYHRSGCADIDWDSDLFIIRSFHTVKLGNMAGRGCSGDGKDKVVQGVFVYKVKGTKRAFVKQFPITVIDGYKNMKWGFIADYWKHRYKSFTNFN